MIIKTSSYFFSISKFNFFHVFCHNSSDEIATQNKTLHENVKTDAAGKNSPNDEFENDMNDLSKSFNTETLPQSIGSFDLSDLPNVTEPRRLCKYLSNKSIIYSHISSEFFEFFYSR